MISVRDLTKRFGSIEAVRSLTFEARPGEILGFLGPNGAGKTTTMRILTGYLNPTEGEARVCGFDVVEASLEVRRRVGYLPENAPLYADMTVFEFLRFAAEAREIPRARRSAAIAAAIEECGLGAVVGRVIGHLSKGYRQRTCLAQALVHRPEVLVLDEPTSGLDPNQIVEIRELVRQLGRDRAIVWSTHILSEVEALCQRVLIVREGRAVALGTPDELRGMVPEQRRLRVLLRAPKEEACAKLASVPGVRSVEPHDGAVEGESGFDLEAEAGSDARDAVFDCAAASGWKIRSMTSVEPSIEDVFRYLTGRGRG